MILRLQKNCARYDLRKFCFTNRIVNMWNSLPNDFVHAECTNTFNPDWIHSGLIRKQFTIIVTKFKELEVEV